MLELDLTGLSCPLPVLKTKKFLANLENGTIVKVITNDPASITDLQNFCNKTGHLLIKQTKEKDKFYTIIQHR